jgi:ribonuclease J
MTSETTHKANPVLTIHRSAHEIGGNCIEIAFDGHRILLDAGSPLEKDTKDSNQLPATLDVSYPLDAVIVSHPHQDHYGLLRGLPESWPVWCGAPTESLMRLTMALTGGTIPQHIHNYTSFKQFDIGPFRITPYLTDHSAFDAHMILVEVGGKRILYSGDFRRTGRKQKLVDRMLKHPPEDIDILLLEGTCLGRTDSFPTETELEEEFASLFRTVPGRVFVTWSAQNIDRTVTIYRACKKTGRALVLDLYSLDVLKRLGEHSSHIPQLEWKEVSGVFTAGINRMYKDGNRMDDRAFVNECFESRMAFGAALLETGSHNNVIMLRPSLLRDYEKKGVKLRDEDAWIFSMWPGYLQEPEFKKVWGRFKNAGARIETVHTSGHASREDLMEFASSIAASNLIPIHSFDWDKHTESFANMKRLQDGETFALG